MKTLLAVRVGLIPEMLKMKPDFSKEDIQSFIANTNRILSSGGEPPKVIRRFPSAMDVALGIIPESIGTASNFRECEGFVVCDMELSDNFGSLDSGKIGVKGDSTDYANYRIWSISIE